MPATSAPPMIRYEVDSLGRRGYTVFTFGNRAFDQSVSGTISRKGLPESYAINIRATDLTKEQIFAIFEALGQPRPPL